MSALKYKNLEAFSETTVAQECGEAVNSDKTMKNAVFLYLYEYYLIKEEIHIFWL